MPVVVGGIIPPADEAALLDAGVARVYTPKDFEVTRIMGDIVVAGGRAQRSSCRLLTRQSWDAGCARATAPPRPRP